MRFTEANVRTYKPPDNKPTYAKWDENLPGFCFRVQAGGNKVYYAKYRIGTKQRWLKIGAVQKTSLESAKRLAKTFFESVQKNVDPANTKAKASAAAVQTFGSAIDGYLEQLETDRLSATHIRRSKSYLEKYFRSLHTIALASLDRATVSRELNLINKRGPIAANRARATLSAFFNWSIANGLCEHNPVDKSIKNKEQSRERVLAPKEIKSIWSNLPADEYGQIVKLLTLTGQRVNEIAGLTWNEINFEEKQIELPGIRTKNSRSHIIPLSPPALAILKSIDRDGKDWVLHDLRRTCSTNMGEQLGIPPHVVEAVLNHMSGSKAGVAGVYNKATYLKEKREALNKYAEYVLTIAK
jgi:integrase